MDYPQNLSESDRRWFDLIQDLRETISELRSLKANLEETLEELRRQLFGTKSEGARKRNYLSGFTGGK